MKYSIIKCFAILFSFFNSCANDHKIVMQTCVQKVNELQSIKKKLHQNALQHHEQLFYDLQTYARTAGQVATAVVLLTDKKNDRSNFYHCTSRLSGNDKAHIIQVVVTAFVLMVEFARFCHARKMHKQMIHAMTYADFVATFPHLLLVEYQILLMKTLIDLTIQGSLPEQIFAKITLTKMSLPYPYAKFANKAAKKMYKKCFDAKGNVVCSDLNAAKHPYKKFTKKIAQSWQEIALRAHSFEKVIEPEYRSCVATFVDTPLNNSCITMIHAGIKNDMQTLQNLHQKFAGHAVIEKLFDYYCCKEA